ncbi:hypothetical protein [Mycobacterium sp. IS-1496]|uniref:hypothetical protein n=1 Tax=Mycobacterium sp. IS-1496 TaxID=1772284 RepID=UPI000A73580E|nr:hypothetical protein [Mycobacterium sp. IS-1496]
MSESFNAARARLAVLTRYRKPGDPELISARRLMSEESVLAVIARQLGKVSPLSAELWSRIFRLVDDIDGAA